jgi:hypothetical protein
MIATQEASHLQLRALLIAEGSNVSPGAVRNRSTPVPDRRRSWAGPPAPKEVLIYVSGGSGTTADRDARMDLKAAWLSNYAEENGLTVLRGEVP